ncbi:MAG: Ig-like domain-containing protein, partial [Muribaculaceae bacterium]|nr:Ig-like domain-containing protein [Muribaculaceae bacterium]
DEEVDMHVGEQYQLEAIISPSTTTDKTLRWTSSNPDIVSVDSNGKVTANALGKAMIEAATTDGSELTASCQVHVNPLAVEQVVINYDGPTVLKAGDKVRLTATVLPENATVKTIEWYSQTGALSVDQNGEVTANSVVEKSWIGAFSPASPYGENPPADFKCDFIYFTVVSTPVERIEIVKDNDMMYAGDTKQLSVSVYPETATDKSVVWESSDPSVITVDADGLLTAHYAGYSDIKATATDGSNVYASVRIYVAVTPVESVTITAGGTTELKTKETLQLTANVYPATATDKNVVWETDNPSRATVDENGLVTAHYELGTVEIRATASGCTDEITLTIVETPAEEVQIYTVGDKTTIPDGSEILLGALVLPGTTTNPIVVWSCSDESVLRLTKNNDGTCSVAATAPGYAYVIATASNGIYGSILIEVTPVLAESITLPHDRLTLNVWQRWEILPEILPANTSVKDWVWESSDKSVGSFMGNVFYPCAQGETTVTCRMTDGSDLSASCVITVVQYATSITLSEHDVTLLEGDSFALTAEILPIDATSKEVMWSSSDESVVTVSNNGVLEAISEGQAVVEVHTQYYP